MEAQLPSVRGFSPNLIAPSAKADPPIIPPSVKRCAEVIYNKRRRDEGFPYDEELLAAEEHQRLQRERFLSSKWSNLFPKLVKIETRTIRLNF